MSIDAPTCLLVDDTPNNLTVLKEYLKDQGYQILVATNGENAITRAKKALPDVILLDVMMPGIDGFETCLRLKADPETAGIPVIFMTALSSPQDKVRGFEVGAIDYVTKPLEAEEVRARVRTHVQNHRYETQLEALVQERTAALEHALALLKEHERVKSDFIRIASHELRTPLSVIGGYASMLDQPGSEPELIVKNLRSGVDRMREIIQEMLEVAWLDTNSLPFEYAPVDVRNLVNLAIYNWKESLVERKITVENQLRLPIIQPDEEHLQKIFDHLLVNAMKFTPDCGHIRIFGQVTEDQQAEISVCDTGVGVDPKDVELIFDKFYRIGSVLNHSSGKTKFKGAGPGLGLTIVKGLVQAHGGTIWVTSPGYSETDFPGSTFTFRIPLQGKEPLPPVDIAQTVAISLQ